MSIVPRVGPSNRLVLVFLSAVVFAIVAGGCPPPEIECPGCTFKTGTFEIEEPRSGYTIESGKMDANVSYSAPCPLKPPPNPCEHSGSKRLTDVSVGEHTEDLPMETGDNGTYDVTVTLVLVASDGSKINETIPVTVNNP